MLSILRDNVRIPDFFFLLSSGSRSDIKARGLVNCALELVSRSWWAKYYRCKTIGDGDADSEKSLLIRVRRRISANVKNTQKYYNHRDEKTKTSTRNICVRFVYARPDIVCVIYFLFSFHVNIPPQPRSPLTFHHGRQIVVQLNTCLLSLFGAVSNSRIRRIRKPSCKNGGLKHPFRKMFEHIQIRCGIVS